jgi:hypothetical protein
MKRASNVFSQIGRLMVSATILNSLLFGCAEPPAPSTVKKPATTTEIGEFAPGAKKEIADPKVPVTDPITGPLAVLKNAQLKIPQIAVEHALNLFQASEGRFPESHAEFMQRIITENQIRLPQLSAGLNYEYDVQNHRLVIVRAGDAALKSP